MYEELSRLLAGELDASAEATLRARIDADPALARAWADMSALPDLLGGLSFDAPPPALAARLAAQMANFEGELPGSADSAEFDPTRFDPSRFGLPDFDPARFDPARFDSADETMDPDVEAHEGLTAPRHPVRARALARAPSSTRGREAFLDQLLAPIQRSPRTASSTPGASARSSRARRVGVTAFVATMALAAGVVLGLNSPDAPLAPEAPAAVAISEGTTTVDGSVDLRAGDVRVRVDGRARVTVTPDAAMARYDGAPYEDAPRIVYGGAGPTEVAPDAVAAYASPFEHVRERIVASWSTVVGGAAPAPTGAPGAAVSAEPTRTAASTPAPSVPNYRVTVQVERGGAQVAYDGLSVALAVGESRTFHAGGMKADRPQEGGHDAFDTPYGTSSEMHEQRDLDRAVRLAAALARTASRDGGETATGASSDVPRVGGPLHDEDRLLSVLEGVPGADLVDIDCSTRPCLALIDYTGDDEAWTDTLGTALASSFDAGVTLTESEVEVEGVLLGLVAVSVDSGKSAGVERAPKNERARSALRDLERELTE